MRTSKISLATMLPAYAILCFLIGWQVLEATVVISRPIPNAVNATKVDDSSGAVEVVAAVAGKKIQIWQVFLATTGTTIEFKSGTNSLTGTMAITQFMQNAPFGKTPGDTAIPIFETNAGENFNLVISGAVPVRGQVSWTTAP